MESDDILRAIKRVLSLAERSLNVQEIQDRIDDPEIKPRHLNPVLRLATARGELASEMLTLSKDARAAAAGQGTRWECWSLASETDPIELGYTYDFETWDTDDPAGMAWMDITIDGEAVEDVVRCRSGPDGFVEVLGVTESGDAASDGNGGIKTEIREGEVSVKRRDTPPGSTVTENANTITLES